MGGLVGRGGDERVGERWWWEGWRAGVVMRGWVRGDGGRVGGQW